VHLFRLYNTLRYLKREQILAQITHRFPGRKHEAVGHPTPPFPGIQLDRNGDPIHPLLSNAASSLREGRFCFVNQEAQVGWPPDWQAAEQSTLWRYNLHYLDWIWSLDLEEAKTIFLDWIEHHPVERGGVGWDPYPLSLRLMNACLFFFQHHRDAVIADEPFRDTLWESLCTQVHVLRQNLEFHLLGNHLLENLVALEVFACCFQGQDHATRNRLQAELDEQILADGMHFERSPMYHLRAVFLLEILVGVGSDCAKDLLEPARQAAARLQHPDGEIALFNDAAFKIYPTVTPSDEKGAWALPDAGYYGWRDAGGNYLICDAAPIGPDYIPGHAHADMLSFEWSICGKRFIVDSGVYDYVPGEMRDYCRSTAAHNTVEINAADQCECWGAFRVARRGYPVVDEWKPVDTGFSLSASHDGYARLHRSLRHRRSFSWQAPGRLTITDEVESTSPARAVTRFHLHPDWQIERLDGPCATLRREQLSVTLRIAGEGVLGRERSWYCPEFYRRVENDCLVFTSSGPGQWTTTFELQAT
jgi:uncharacterized heparinase superfamily protein